MKPSKVEGKYDIYPAFNAGIDKIHSGFETLAEYFGKHQMIIVEGYTGVFFDIFREEMDRSLRKAGLTVHWIDTSDFLKSPLEIEEMVSPFTGGDDPVFGKRSSLEMADFFDSHSLREIKTNPGADINIIIGPGASLTGLDGSLVYLDVPKNEIQYRSRAGSITNLGDDKPGDPGEMYKRFYFVDWIVLNKLKSELLPRIDIIVDCQHPGNPAWMTGNVLRESLGIMSRNFFRTRPWFEPGVWGGSWISNNIRGLSTQVPNYAWSFELITAENGLLFESSGKLMEVSFDFLMYHDAMSVLGDCFLRFGFEFPIRFDFLDTFDGGNLSIQCHPRPGYMKEHFNENFTQEETYYILDNKDNAVVYLGFQDDIDPDAFRTELEESFSNSKHFSIDRYIQKHPSVKHGLYLVPYGTVHGSGRNNLVLEISTTPYIFTFKMYDWLRPDLNGKPRPLNIGRAFDNLYFDRKGNYVKEKLISEPVLVAEEKEWKLYHLPTHETHLYDVHRLHIKGSVDVVTNNKLHVLSLVEGKSITVETKNGLKGQFSYVETFVIPAAAISYRIINTSETEVMVIMAFVK